MEAVKVIVKMVREEDGSRTPVLFFPQTPTRFGLIECWELVGQHCDADQSWYWKMNNPRPAEEEKVEQLLLRYEYAYKVKLNRVKRDSHKMRSERWKQ